MCARAAGGRGRKVLVLEHAPRPGMKILVSGGGRCNFTNLTVDAHDYVSANPHFCKSALSRFTPQDMLALLHQYRIAYEEREHGQLFLRKQSSQLVDMLLQECARVEVTIQTNCQIRSVTRAALFEVQTAQGVFSSRSLVIASGGLAWPQGGSTGIGYQIARQFGLQVLPCLPGLVPLRLPTPFEGLAGVSVPARVSCQGYSFRDPILFTHQGLSGPAILQISNHWQPGQEIVIDWLPDTDLRVQCKEWQATQPKTEFKNLLRRHLPQSLASTLTQQPPGNKPMRQYTPADIEKLCQALHACRLYPSDTAGFGKAEVTRGGVDTRELCSKTFEANQVPGLYFAGEVVDVTGSLGGYNLHWAWASGYCAGLYA